MSNANHFISFQAAIKTFAVVKAETFFEISKTHFRPKTLVPLHLDKNHCFLHDCLLTDGGGHIAILKSRGDGNVFFDNAHRYDFLGELSKKVSLFYAEVTSSQVEIFFCETHQHIDSICYSNVSERDEFLKNYELSIESEKVKLV